MTKNSDITLFNKWYDKSERTERFFSTKITGVSLCSRKGTASGDKGLTEGDSYTIRIPADADSSGKTYVDPMMYVSLNEEEVAGYWTLQPGAIIVRGLSDLKEATETELQKAYPDVIFVKNYTDNRDRCSEFMRHWRVGGQ